MRPNVKPPVDREKVETEARAKMIWGEGEKEVLGFLLLNGYSREEAFELVNSLIQERVATVRGIGIRRIIVGAGMVTLPVVAYIVMFTAGVIYVYLLGALGVGGVWGLWKLIQGIRMVCAPKTQGGDLADEMD